MNEHNLYNTAMIASLFAHKPVDRRTFMITTQQEEVVGELDFVAHQQAHRFQILPPTINVIAQEHVVGVWWKAASVQNAQQISVLAMRVTTNTNGRIDFNE